MEMESNNEEWVSVSDMAQRLGVSKQTVYNYIKEHRFATKEFSRGTMRGLLVSCPSSSIQHSKL
jgi:excisionase family DNA binding protein